MDKSPLYLSFARGEVRCMTCFLPLIILPASFYFFTFSTFHLSFFKKVNIENLAVNPIFIYFAKR